MPLVDLAAQQRIGRLGGEDHRAAVGVDGPPVVHQRIERPDRG
jgi:hypothetical protein